MGDFIRERLPEPVGFFEAEGVPLKGRGKWKTGPCHFHDGSDSLRVQVESGAWRCMACHVKGGDVLGYTMQRHGLEFVEAARALGAYVDGKAQRRPGKPATLAARDAMQLIAFELIVALLVMSDIKRGVIPSDGDWQRFLEAAGRVDALAMEYRA